MLLDAFTRLLDGHCTPAFARACAADPALAQPLAAEIEAAGFFDILRAEAEGGADAGLPALAPLLIACGERLAADASPELLATLRYLLQLSPVFSLRGGTREILRGMIARGLGLR